MSALAHHMRVMASYHRHATATLLDGIKLAMPSEFNNLGALATNPGVSTTSVRRVPRVSPYRKDSKLFFRSIHGTLNHLLGAETLWWHRLAGSSEDAADIAAIYELNRRDLSHAWERRIESRAELFERLLHTTAAWEELVATGVARDGQLDEVIHTPSSAYSPAPPSASDIDDAWFMDSVEYTDTDGRPRSVVRAAALTQVFNHATHHRGQITAAFTYWGEDFPSLDMQNMGDHFTQYTAHRPASPEPVELA
jgi:uncharacterized damage-inducible protein DinB